VSSVQPLLAQRIEVVRGAATILYGSSAIGGVVNVLDNRIPTEVPTQPVKGEFVNRFDSANMERSGAGSVDIRASEHVVLHLDGAIRRTENVRIPGNALSDSIRAGLSADQRARGSSFGGDPVHVVPNTGVFSRDFGLGTSYVWDGGFIGASFGQSLSVYGVPNNPSVDDPVDMPGRVRLDMVKRQYSLRGAINDPFPAFASGNFKFTYTDYRHVEIERDSLGVDEVGSTFKTNGFDSRIELVHHPIGKMEGSIGTQALVKNLKVVGSEAFLQPTHTLQLGGFLFEEIKLNPVRLQVGARVEYNRVEIDSSDPTLTSLTSDSQRQREYIPLSFAAGAIYDITKETNLALTTRYSERAPAAEELFANGPHEATHQFIVGDPNLNKERVIGIDLSLRKRSGLITGSIGGFYNHFLNFLEITNTGAVSADNLPIFNYNGKRAGFLGGEARVACHLLPLSTTRPGQRSDGKSLKELVSGREDSSMPNPHDLYVEFRGDYVRAEDRAEGRPLPRIPALRYGTALVYEGPRFGGRVEAQRVSGQTRVSAFETTTPGYTFLNANVSYSFVVRATKCDVYLRGNNLTDATAREHSSFLKEVLPLAGRSVSLGMRVAF
jgi:iron complex outermembrane receptor protein